MARPRKVKPDEPKEEVGYTVVKSETTGWLVKHGSRPVYVAASEDAANKYVALLMNK